MKIADIFNPQNKVWSAISKLGSIGFVDICTVVCCVPVVTFVPALTALYYTTVKNIRRDRSYAWKEYFHAFRSNLKSGMIVSLGSLLYFLITYLWYCMSVMTDGYQGRFCFVVSAALALLYLATIVWLIPVLSRFECSLPEALKYSLFLAIRYLFRTVFFVVMLAVCVQLVLILPVLWVVMLGLYALLVSFFVERVFLDYTNKAGGDEDADIDAWYLEK